MERRRETVRKGRDRGGADRRAHAGRGGVESAPKGWVGRGGVGVRPVALLGVGVYVRVVRGEERWAIGPLVLEQLSLCAGG